MTLNDFKEIDSFLENKEVKYGDIDITYLVRNHVISRIRAKEKAGFTEVKITGKMLIKFLKLAIKSLPGVLKRKSFWVLSDSERRKMIGPLYYDRVASVVSEYSDDTLFIEKAIYEGHKRPTKDVVLSESIFYLCSFAASLFCFRESKLIVDDRVYEWAENQGITLNIYSNVKRHLGQYFFLRFFLRYFHNPKLVFEVNPNSYNGYNLAFKERGIPVVELQHGIIYPLHPSYNTILFDKARPFKPEYIFTYGTKDSQRLIEEMNYLPSEKVCTIGYFGLWKAKMVSEPGQYIQSQMVNGLKTLAIIATVQDIDELYEFAIDVATMLSLNVLILPRYSVSHLKNTDNVHILDVGKTNIFEVYKIADFLLSKTSTCALEALYMNIPTFVLESDKGLKIFSENYSYVKSFNYVVSSEHFCQMVQESSYKFPENADVDQVFQSGNILSNFKNALINVR